MSWQRGQTHLGQEGLSRLLCTYMQQVLIHIQREPAGRVRNGSGHSVEGHPGAQHKAMNRFPSQSFI